MLGLPRISTSPHDAYSARLKRKESVWWHLVQCDSYLSLLLGLPSFIPATAYDVERNKTSRESPVPASYYRRKLSIVVGKISQRNQIDTASSLSATNNIGRELHNLVNLMPTHWWHLVPLSKEASLDIYAIFDCLATQFLHYQAQAYLHLPFMLQSPADARFDNNRTQCLIASRKMTQIYIKMREHTGGRIYVCRLMIFQTFTAAIIMILGLLGYDSRLGREDKQQKLGDWALIDQTVEILRQISHGREDLTAAQCLLALERLITIARGHITTEPRKYRIFIPYFGMISVAPRYKYQVATTMSPKYPTEINKAVPDQESQDFMVQTQDHTKSAVIDIDVFNAPFLGSFGMASQHLPRLTESDEFSFQDALAMDIDQDWNWMLNL